MNDILREVEKPHLREQKVDFAPGDTLRVHVRIREGEKERVQVFQGTVIGRRGGGMGAVWRARHLELGVERAVKLSVEKYCAATAMMAKSADVSHDIDIVDTRA